MEQLSWQAASFLYSETARSPIPIGALAIYDPATTQGGKQHFKDILAFIEDLLDLGKTSAASWLRCHLILTIPIESRTKISTLNITSDTFAYQNLAIGDSFVY